MNRWNLPYALVVVGLLAAWLTGCTLNRPANQAEAGEIAAPAFQPPTSAAAVAQVDAVVRVQPSALQLNVGDITVIEIRIDNVTDLYAVDIQMSFDPAILQVLDADPAQDGVQIEPGDFLAADFVVDNEVDNVTGDIFYAVTQLGSTPPVSGSGVLARVSIQAIAPGTSIQDFTLTQLVTITNGNPVEIPVISQPGQVIVPGSGQPTSTFTPTPTLAPGQPTPTFTPTPTIIVITPTPLPTFSPTPTPTPTPTSTPVPLADVPEICIPPDATYGFCYRVQPDETLASIGNKFGVDPRFINLANDLNPPGYVFQNQALFIPQTYGHGPNAYYVRLGDTMASIADVCHITVEYLAQVNGISTSERLTLNKGETVRLEDGSVITLPDDRVRIPALLIPVPPFAPPSRYPYPGSVSPPVSPPPCPPPVCGQPPCQ